jgi:hypothetical protein
MEKVSESHRREASEQADGAARITQRNDSQSTREAEHAEQLTFFRQQPGVERRVRETRWDEFSLLRPPCERKMHPLERSLSAAGALDARIATLPRLLPAVSHSEAKGVAEGKFVC